MLTPDFPPVPGGIQAVSGSLAGSASRLQIDVVTIESPNSAELDRDQPFAIRRAGGRRLPHRARIAWLNAASLREGLRSRPAAVLSMHIVTSPAARTLRRVLSVPVVQYLHADEIRGRPRLASRAVRAANAVVAVSGHTQRLALELGAEPTRVHVVPNGVDIPQDPRSARGPEQVVLTVARLTQTYKGHDVMLRALPLIRERVPNARWVVVGDGPLRRSLERAAAAGGLQDAVSFIGAVDDHERDRWLARARVFAMPSRLPEGGLGGEGFGIVYLEAAAHGLPVVAGNVGGALDAVEDGRTGILVDPTDHEVVADAVAGLLEDRQRAEALGQAGIERSRRFAWPQITAQVEDILLGVTS